MPRVNREALIPIKALLCVYISIERGRCVHHTVALLLLDALVQSACLDSCSLTCSESECLKNPGDAAAEEEEAKKKQKEEEESKLKEKKGTNADSGSKGKKKSAEATGEDDPAPKKAKVEQAKVEPAGGSKDASFTGMPSFGTDQITFDVTTPCNCKVEYHDGQPLQIIPNDLIGNKKLPPGTVIAQIRDGTLHPGQAGALPVWGFQNTQKALVLPRGEDKAVALEKVIGDGGVVAIKGLGNTRGPTKDILKSFEATAPLHFKASNPLADKFLAAAAKSKALFVGRITLWFTIINYFSNY